MPQIPMPYVVFASLMQEYEIFAIYASFKQLFFWKIQLTEGFDFVETVPTVLHFCTFADLTFRFLVIHLQR